VFCEGLSKNGSRSGLSRGSWTFGTGRDSKPISLATTLGALVPCPSSLVTEDAQQLESLLWLLLELFPISSTSIRETLDFKRFCAGCFDSSESSEVLPEKSFLRDFPCQSNKFKNPPLDRFLSTTSIFSSSTDNTITESLSWTARCSEK
jgi:hypothetical protein